MSGELQGQQLRRVLQEAIFTDHRSENKYLKALSACSKAKAEALSEARILYSQVVINGVDSPLSFLLGNYLAVTLAKCGSLCDGLHIALSLPCRSVFSWTAIITALTDADLPRDALHLYPRMHDDGVYPDHFAFVSLLRACSTIPHISHGRILHTVARSSGFGEDPFVCSILVTMYGKCGSIKEAESVFNSIPGPDTVLWNAMLCAYLDQQQENRAFELYNAMQERCVSCNQRTYVIALQCCATLAEKGHVQPLETGNALHSEVVLKGFINDSFVSNSLLSMYAKCGSLGEAKHVFYNMCERSLVSWNAMLSAYVLSGHADRALLLYLDMQRQRFLPDELTFVSAIQACIVLAEKEELLCGWHQPTKSIALDIGQALHSDARKAGYAIDSILCNTLVKLYGTCGATKEAEHIFGSIPHDDAVLWNVMLSAYIEQGQAKKALQLYTQMQREGQSPDERILTLAIQACGSLVDDEDPPLVDADMLPLDIGYSLHADIYVKGFTIDAFLGSALVRMYGKCGPIQEAEYIFSTSPDLSVVLCNALMSSYILHRQPQYVLKLYMYFEDIGVGTDKLTLVTAIQACSLLIDEDSISFDSLIEIGQALYADARRKGFISDVFVCNTLMSMYGKFGDICEVEQLFKIISNCDLVSWNTMLSAYVERDHGDTALQFYTKMIGSGFIPDARTTVIVLQACASLVDKEKIAGKRIPLEITQALHADACIEGIDSNVVVASSLVNIYGKFGATPEAEFIFSELHEKNMVTWTALLSAYVERGQVEKGMELYKEMQKYSVTISHVTIICVLEACIVGGCLDFCEQIHFDIVSAGYDHIPSVSAAILHAYASCGSMIDGQSLFDNLLVPDIVSWNTTIGGHAGAGKAMQTLQLFEQLNFSCTLPDGLTLTSILSACSHNGLIGHGLEYLSSMTIDYGLVPDLKHYGCVMDLLGRAGDFKRAQNMLETMPLEADMDTFLSLLGACRAHGNVEIAQQAFDDALNLNPDQATAYVLMSNICADVMVQNRIIETETCTLNAPSFT